MKIWDLNKSEEIEQPKEMKEFIDEIIKVMKKYNLSISHEDSHGAFIIEKYEEYNIKWLKDAMKNYWNERRWIKCHIYERKLTIIYGKQTLIFGADSIQ